MAETLRLTDEDITTTWPGRPGDVRASTGDPDAADPDTGTIGDTDTTDVLDGADGGDADGTDITDTDGTDS